MARNGWLRRLVRFVVVRHLVSSGVTPEQVFAARVALSVLASCMLAWGTAWFSAAAFACLMAILLDRCEGELVLAMGQVNPFGDRQTVTSRSLPSLQFIGLGVGLQASEQGLAAIGMGLMAGLSMAAIPWLVHRLEAIDGRPSAEFDGVAGLDADDLSLLIPLSLWAGWAEGLMVVAAFGAPAFACAFYLTHFRKFNAGL